MTKQYAVCQNDDGLVRRIYHSRGAAKRSITMGHWVNCFVVMVLEADGIHPGSYMEYAAQYARRGRI